MSSMPGPIPVHQEGDFAFRRERHALDLAGWRERCSGRGGDRGRAGLGCCEPVRAGTRDGNREGPRSLARPEHSAAACFGDACRTLGRRWSARWSRPESYGLSYRWRMPAAGSEVWGRSPWPRSLPTCDLNRPLGSASQIPKVQLKLGRPQNRGQPVGKRHDRANRKRLHSSRDLFCGRQNPAHYDWIHFF